MRQPTDICLLCRNKNSDKKNSHLIPKFFGTGIFEGTKPRHGLQISKNGKTSKIQDIMKEDFLFCPSCEKGLSIFETYCALRLRRFDDPKHYKQFKRFKRGEFRYFECNEVDIKIFNLFVYSIVWRLSISNHPAFLNFNILTSDEEKLRQIINDFIVSTQSELLDKIDSLIELPLHSHVMIRPKKKQRPPSSMLSAASLNSSIHQIHLVDYLVFYVTDRSKLIHDFVEIDNNNLDRNVRIGLTTSELWEKFNFNLINKLQN